MSAPMSVGESEETEAREALAGLDEILGSEDPVGGMARLLESGRLLAWLPEVHAIVGFHESCPVHHKDLWAHTMEVMERTEPDLGLRWAVLMHDVGKIDTRALDARHRVTFHRHEERGAVMMGEVARRMAMAPKRAARISFIIEHHGWVNAYERSWSDRAVRRLIRLSGPYLEDLLNFSRWDYTTRRGQRRRRIAATLAHLTERIERVRHEDAAVVHLPRGLGDALSKAHNIPPGPELGALIGKLKQRVEAGEVPREATLEALIAATMEQ